MPTLPHAGSGGQPRLLHLKEASDVPRGAWSAKRERQYEHVKDSYEDRGVSEDEAEERAARTVNKERREAGETKSGRRKS